MLLIKLCWKVFFLVDFIMSNCLIRVCNEKFIFMCSIWSIVWLVILYFICLLLDVFIMIL